MTMDKQNTDTDHNDGREASECGELLPYPSTNTVPVYRYDKGPNLHAYTITGDGCFIKAWGRTKEEAITRWNNLWTR
jgi:hypothetical protein